MSKSQILTIIIVFHMPHQRDFKNFYLGIIHRYHKSEFLTLLSYTRFLEVMPSVLVPLSSFFTHVKGEPTGIEFIDSTSIKAFHNLRIPRHKVFKGTVANTDDRKPVRELSKGLFDKIHADKGYISKALTEDLKEDRITLITTHRKNMKPKAIAAWDRALLSKRFIIETINDQLKNISQIEHSRHRSLHGFMLNLLRGLIAYCL